MLDGLNMDQIADLFEVLERGAEKVR